MKLSKAIDEFKSYRGFNVCGHTVTRYDRVLRIFCLCIGDPEIEEIKSQHILGYMHDMERLGWHRHGISIVALAFRTFFQYFNRQGYKCINEAVIPLPRKKFSIPRVASEKDYKKLVRAIPRDTNPNNIRNLALINMVWDSWARTGEIISLDEEDLKFNKDNSGSAIIMTEKSRGKRPIREIFWTSRTGRNLKRWIKKKHDLEKVMSFEDPQAVFTSIRKCGLYDSRGKRMTPRGVCEVFRMISNRARLPSIFNAHSARHYGGRKIIKEGGSNSDVSNILGHSNMESSMIYTMLWGDDLHERWIEFSGSKPKNVKQHNHIFHGALRTTYPQNR